MRNPPQVPSQQSFSCRPSVAWESKIHMQAGPLSKMSVAVPLSSSNNRQVPRSINSACYLPVQIGEVPSTTAFLANASFRAADSTVRLRMSLWLYGRRNPRVSRPRFHMRELATPPPSPPPPPPLEEPILPFWRGCLPNHHRPQACKESSSVKSRWWDPSPLSTAKVTASEHSDWRIRRGRRLLASS